MNETSNKKIALITGITGFVGRALAKSIISQNKYTLLGLSRSETDLPVKCLNIGDLSPTTNYQNILKGQAISIFERIHKEVQEASVNNDDW